MKEYKRLTDKEHRYKKCVSCTYRNCQYCDDDIEYAHEVHNRLAKLEDKIENGTLIELPCKYGNTAWFVYETENDEMFLDEGVIQSFSIDSCGLWVYVIYKSGLTYWHTIEAIGERLFLTKAEAEAKLKELQNER